MLGNKGTVLHTRKHLQSLHNVLAHASSQEKKSQNIKNTNLFEDKKNKFSKTNKIILSHFVKISSHLFPPPPPPQKKSFVMLRRFHSCLQNRKYVFNDVVTCLLSHNTHLKNFTHLNFTNETDFPGKTENSS